MHYVIGDPHGHYTSLMKLIDKLNLSPDDKVVITGDICDRAPTPYEQRAMIDWAIKSVTDDGQFQMVLGNHELDILHNIKAIYRDVMDELGDCTSQDVYKRLGERDNSYGFFSKCKKANIDLMKLWVFIQKLPLFKMVDYNNHKYFITHAWLVPKHDMGFKLYEDELEYDEDDTGDVYLKGDVTADVDDLVMRYIAGTASLAEFDVQKSVWERSKSIYCTNNKYTIIHGHTPPVIKEYYEVNDRGKVVIKQGNINVDCGLFTSGKYNGNLAAYCIETGRVVYLYDEDFYTKYIDTFSEGNYKIACILQNALYGTIPSKDNYTENLDFDIFEFLHTGDMNLRMSNILEASHLRDCFLELIKGEQSKTFLQEMKE